MDMIKEEARDILENWLESKSVGYYDGTVSISLPIIDEVVTSIKTERGIEQWSFKGLIKIAYDL